MLPFTLKPHEDGTWHTRWAEEKLFIRVAGTPDAADPEMLAALADVVERWADVRRDIQEYVAGLAAEDHVPLDPASIGGFAARNCGFDQELFFDAISAQDREHPDRVEVTFYTGYPDGYATYCVVLIAGEPTTVSAYAA